MEKREPETIKDGKITMEAYSALAMEYYTLAEAYKELVEQGDQMHNFTESMREDQNEFLDYMDNERTYEENFYYSVKMFGLNYTRETSMANIEKRLVKYAGIIRGA